MQINTRTNTVKLTKNEGSTLAKAADVLQAIEKHMDHPESGRAKIARENIDQLLVDLDPGAEPSK